MKFYLIAFRAVDAIEWEWVSGSLGPILYSKRVAAEERMAAMVEESDCECFLIFSEISLTEDFGGNGIKVARYEALG